MVSLSSGLLQFVSSANLVTPDSEGSSATSNNGLSQLSALANQLQSTAKSQTSTSSSSSTRLADDTYTPSTLSLIGQSFSASSKASSSSTASVTSSSQGSQSDTVTLANLVKNQTISGSSEVRQALLAAIEPYLHDDVSDTWKALADKVKSGDLSGAQTALDNYDKALTNAHYDLSGSDENQFAAVKSVLQTGNRSDAEAAIYSLGTATDDIGLGYLRAYESGYGTNLDTPGGVEWAAQHAADALQKIGYTESNATVEANAILLGLVAQDESGYSVSVDSQEDQGLIDLAKAATNLNSDGQGATTDTATMSSILTSMFHAKSLATMETTLTQLASQYGSAAQGTGADNARQASVSVYA